MRNISQILSTTSRTFDLDQIIDTNNANRDLVHLVSDGTFDETHSRNWWRH